MGMRAVMQMITPDSQEAFYAQYGSPDYKLPALADWLASHATGRALAGQVPSAAAYLEQTEASDFDHFREGYHSSRLPSDLDWTYQLTITTAGQGRQLRGPAWFGHLIVRGPALWRGGVDAPSAPLAHMVRFDADDDRQLRRLVLRSARYQLSLLDSGLFIRDPEDWRRWWAGIEAQWIRYDLDTPAAAEKRP